MCKVSVLVPVYNVKTYLHECLDSLAAQTLDSIEFVCIDDGSTDGCSEILDAYAARDERFRVIHKENSGYGASMNVGLRAARGKYIGIVESDDFADAEMFEKLFEAAEKYQAEVVSSNFWAMKRGISTFSENWSGCAYEKVFSPIQEDSEIFLAGVNIWTGLYRKTFLQSHDIWFHETPGASYQDLSFAFMTMACAERYVLLKEAYLHYRMDNAASSMHSKTKVYCVMDEYDAMEKYLQTHQGTAEQHRWAAKMFVHHCWFNDKRNDLETMFPFWTKAVQRLLAAHQEGWFEHEMTKQPEIWMFHHLEDIQQEKLLCTGFLTHLQMFSHVYLYGAGKVAQHLLDILASYKIRVTGFLVDCPEENPASIADLPVASWKEASVDREHDLVVIAVTPRKPEVQQEIFFQLEQAGYRNVIVLTKELQEALA